MTNKKAAEIIKYHKILVDKDTSGLLDKELEYEAIDMAVEALEKQKAKVKQENVEHYSYEDTPRYTGYITHTQKGWICCNCKTEVRHKDAFCRGCGAQLQWKSWM